jgi:UDP-N-acetylmuramyl pentapeptide phosphotransferase/UDP-N-acetylglucosamine-1-phosphate transferase
VDVYKALRILEGLAWGIMALVGLFLFLLALGDQKDRSYMVQFSLCVICLALCGFTYMVVVG